MGGKSARRAKSGRNRLNTNDSSSSEDEERQELMKRRAMLNDYGFVRKENFDTSLLKSCTKEAETSCVTCCFPWYTSGRVANTAGKSFWLQCLCFFACGLPLPANPLVCAVYQQAKRREAVRKLKNIEGDITGDCMAVWCCPLCAIAQEALELEVFSDECYDETVTQEPIWSNQDWIEKAAVIAREEQMTRATSARRGTARNKSAKMF